MPQVSTQITPRSTLALHNNYAACVYVYIHLACTVGVQLKDILVPFFQARARFFSLCIASLQVAAWKESITNVQLAHSEEYHPYVCLLTFLLKRGG